MLFSDNILWWRRYVNANFSNIFILPLVCRPCKVPSPGPTSLDPLPADTCCNVHVKSRLDAGCGRVRMRSWSNGDSSAVGDFAAPRQTASHGRRLSDVMDGPVESRPAAAALPQRRRRSWCEVVLRRLVSAGVPDARCPPRVLPTGLRTRTWSSSSARVPLCCHQRHITQQWKMSSLVINRNKKLSCRREAARCFVSVSIQHCERSILLRLHIYQCVQLNSVMLSSA